VSAEETNKEDIPLALARIVEDSPRSRSIGRESKVMASESLTLNARSQMTKEESNNKIKEAVHVAQATNRLRPEKEATQAEMEEKNKCPRRGRGRLAKGIGATMEEEQSSGTSKGAPRTARTDSVLVRSSSLSTLSPGSWECSHCTFINESVGLEPPTGVRVCQLCNLSNREGTHSCSSRNTPSREESVKLLDVIPPSASTEDDINIMSWSDLDDVLESTARMSSRSR
jgi:hypothetical protein